jgi:antitoxin (DNA-binding transcriptional repressor) of toxin-antitoxin stability system
MAMTSMTVTQARAALPELLTRVQDGEEFTITRHGQPAAVLVRPDVLRIRRAEVSIAGAWHVHELLASAAAAPLAPAADMTADRAEELIREIRKGRSSR